MQAASRESASPLPWHSQSRPPLHPENTHRALAPLIAPASCHRCILIGASHSAAFATHSSGPCGVWPFSLPMKGSEGFWSTRYWRQNNAIVDDALEPTDHPAFAGSQISFNSRFGSWVARGDDSSYLPTSIQPLNCLVSSQLHSCTLRIVHHIAQGRYKKRAISGFTALSLHAASNPTWKSLISSPLSTRSRICNPSDIQEQAHSPIHPLPALLLSHHKAEPAIP